jgi:hypothetical protein
MFNEEMAHPGETVTDDQAERDKPEVAGENCSDQADNSGCAADEVEQSATRF